MAIEEKFNHITGIISQDTFPLEPVWQESLWLSNLVNWVFTIPMAGPDIPPLDSVPVDAAKNGTRTLLAAPGANKQIWVYGWLLTGLAIGTCKLQDSTPTARTGEMHIAAQGGNSPPRSDHANQPWFKCATNKALQAVLSANLDLDGVLLYRIVEV